MHNDSLASLVPVVPGQIGGTATHIISARSLYKALGVGRDFTTWIKSRIDEYGFIEGIDYAIFDSPISGNQSTNFEQQEEESKTKRGGAAMTAQILNYKNFVVPCAVKGYKTSVTRLSNTTYKNYVGQYVLRPNLPRHCLALVGRTTKTVAGYGIFTSSGLCFLSQSLSAAFMRVCQPLPVALNASTTSGEQRKVTRTLGFIAFGRPGLTSFSPSYNAAPEKNASSSSGASSGSVQVFFKSCVFAFIGFPHGDNTPYVTAWRPDQDYNAPVEFSGCYVPCLAVILAYILSGEMFARKHLTCPRKIKVALVKRPVAFVIVEVNFHTIIVRTINNFAICHLPLHTTACYRNSALYKTSAGIETPCKLSATPDAASVFFVVCYTRHSMAWCAYLMTNSPQAFDHATAHRAALIMVTLAGQPQGWPVSDNTGSLNPVNVTAPIEIETSSGDSVNLLSEAAAMVATPAQTRPEFIFYFLAVRRADLHDIPHREAVTAPDELTARRSLAGRYVLSFAGRIPVQGVRHV